MSDSRERNKSRSSAESRSGNAVGNADRKTSVPKEKTPAAKRAAEVKSGAIKNAEGCPLAKKCG